MKHKISMRTRYILEGYSFISLWIAGFLLFMAVPLGRSIYYSFQDLKTSQGGLLAHYVGTKHYRAAFTTDIDFLPLLKNTMTNMATQVPLILIFSMFCALLLNRNMIGKSFFRGVFFLPVIIASGAILRKLLDQGAANLPIFYNQGLYGKLNAFIPDQVLEPLLRYAESLTLVMWDSGVQILIFLAGLQTISPQLYENNMAAQQLSQIASSDAIGMAPTVLNQMMAAVMLTILPVLILYLLVQRHFVESVERSGIAGE